MNKKMNTNDIQDKFLELRRTLKDNLRKNNNIPGSVHASALAEAKAIIMSMSSVDIDLIYTRGYHRDNFTVNIVLPYLHFVHDHIYDLLDDGVGHCMINVSANRTAISYTISYNDNDDERFPLFRNFCEVISDICDTANELDVPYLLLRPKSEMLYQYTISRLYDLADM